MKNDTIYGFVTVRTASTRLPNKCLLLINKLESIKVLIKRIKSRKYSFNILTSNTKSDDFLCDILKDEKINIFRGNPDLNPTYSNNIDFGYLKRFESSFTINTSAYFQRSTDTYNFINQENGETVQLNGVEIPVDGII